MKNSSNKRIPQKYRYLQKKIDEIHEFFNKIPTPSPDYAAFPPHERDLVELYHGCLALAAREQKNQLEKLGYETDTIKLDEKLFASIASQYFTKDDLLKAKELTRNAPTTIGPKKDRFWFREPIQNLIAYLNNAKMAYSWLPQGRINYANLTWVAWEELLTLLDKYGYERETDRIENVIPCENWSAADRWILIRLYLEMIDDDTITNRFNLKQGHGKKKFVIRRRLYFFARIR